MLTKDRGKKMKIAGFQRFSMIDFPNKIAAVIFTQGCNFRCGFCHNPETVLPAKYSELIQENVVLDFLDFRKNQLEGVVITGGEPTLQDDLPLFLQQIKNMGYNIKLDTNGTNPDIIGELIDENLIDHIAMDIKAPLDKYKAITNTEVKLELIQASIALIQSSELPHEFRTTVMGELFSDDDMKQMHELVNFSENYKLQQFQPDKKLVDEKFFSKEYKISDEQLNRFNNSLGLLKNTGHV